MRVKTPFPLRHAQVMSGDPNAEMNHPLRQLLGETSASRNKNDNDDANTTVLKHRVHD